MAFITVDTSLCAHSRKSQVGCTRCLDACPASALVARGDHVSVNPMACDGHGACAAACPSGAIRYGDGDAAAILPACAGAVLLIHDPQFGAPLVEVMAEHEMLPPGVLPLLVPSVAALGLEFILTGMARGAARLIVHAHPSRRRALEPLEAAVGQANAILSALGWGGRAEVLVAADPDEVAACLAAEAGQPLPPAADFLAVGTSRAVLGMALRHLHETSSTKGDIVPLERGAPLGGVEVDGERCTLCLACVGACPTQALGAGGTVPALTFTEAQCIQCGLCKATCPERAVTLRPRVNFSENARKALILKEDEPFCCTACGKPFASRAAIGRMLEKLAGHPMFAEGGKLESLKKCESCRAIPG